MYAGVSHGPFPSADVFCWVCPAVSFLQVMCSATCLCFMIQLHVVLLYIDVRCSFHQCMIGVCKSGCPVSCVFRVYRYFIYTLAFRTYSTFYMYFINFVVYMLLYK